MRIIKFTAENIKKLTLVEITPAGNVVTITGKNGSGKTSVLDAIWWALTSAHHIQVKPIRKGEKQARIRLELGKGEVAELIVERRFAAKEASGPDQPVNETHSQLIIENPSGARFRSPTAMLEKLVGALSFDPSAFVVMPPAQQYEAVRNLVKLEVDIDALDGLNQKDFEQRTEINRRAKALRAQADGVTLPADCPTERRDTQEILARLTGAADHNATIERLSGERKAERERIATLNRLAREKTDLAIHLRDEAATLVARAKAANDEALHFSNQAQLKTENLEAMLPLAEPMDATAIRAELQSAEDTNLLVDRKHTKEHWLHGAEALETTANSLTETMDARAETKRKAIAAAKMPVDGLSFEDGEVTYNGVPFSQASTAEQLRVSVAIAMAANPQLRVIRIQHGNDLDREGMQLLANLAEQHDYQIWIERVDDTGKIGIVLEDGHVKAPPEHKPEGADGPEPLPLSAP